MGLFFFLKLLVVIFFLVMFLRGSKVIWGIGLITVTTAFLLDTVLGTFGRDEMLARMGFFFYVLSGGLVGGTAVWLMGLLRDYVGFPAGTAKTTPSAQRLTPTKNSNTAFDRQMLYQQIRDRLGPDDIHDLIFDLEFNENDVISPTNQDMGQVIIRIMDIAEERGQTGPLSLAVERILTPLPPENLPRREKLSPDSPRTVLRQFLLTFYTQSELKQLAEQLDIDWEQLHHRSKKELLRSMLLYLYRRNRLADLMALIQKPTDETTE